MPSKRATKAPPPQVVTDTEFWWTRFLTAPCPFPYGMGETIRAVVDTIPKPPSWWQQPELFAVWKARYGHRI